MSAGTTAQNTSIAWKLTLAFGNDGVLRSSTSRHEASGLACAGRVFADSDPQVYLNSEARHFKLSC